MRRKFTLTLAGISLLALASCSTGKLAQSGVDNDDVYNPVAKAKELPKYEDKQPSYRTDEQLYGGNDYADEDYGGEYAARIDRFYYNRPWGSFYDNYYSYRYDPWSDYYYGFNSWYRPGISIGIGWGSPFYNNYYYGGYYGSPYYSRYWGPYSYYNSYPGYYGGYYPRYGYGYDYPGRAYTSPNYRSRPNRETNIGRGASGGYTPAPSRGTTSTTGRPERTPSGIGTTSTRPPASGTSGSSTQPSRPSRTEEVRTPRESGSPRPQSRPVEYSRPERTPSGSSSGGSSSGSSSSGSSSSGGSSSRPSRGGR